MSPTHLVQSLLNKTKNSNEKTGTKRASILACPYAGPNLSNWKITIVELPTKGWILSEKV